MIVTNRGRKTSGFTLVELAIVMVVIGLLISGILNGRQLIETARIAATIKEVNATRAAFNTFQDRFLSMPGDMSTATTRLAGCNSTSFCQNGDGNSMVGMGSYPGLSAVVSGQAETVQFWKHLAMADLITGIDPTANWASPELGKTHPTAAIKGGYEFFYDPSFYGRWPAHVLRLNALILVTGTGTAGIGSVSPHVAAQFERKMDDGNAGTGNLIVWEHGNLGCDDLADGTKGQAEASTDIACTLMFKMD